MYLPLLCLFASLGISNARTIDHVKGRFVKPAAFFLAGDSTTATQSSNGGGWGDGFLKTLVNGSFGTNFGHNGATTVSFVAGGDWANVLNSVKTYKTNYTSYVTIQFGHNDQKATANITVAQFQTNLENMVTDVRNAGGTPILVTSLSRRSYDSAGKIVLNLAVQVAATLAAANKTGSAVIDLNKASTAYLNAIGETDAMKYNLNPDDTTHLNYQGSVVFGNMVGDLILKSKIGRAVKAFLKLDSSILKAIASGTFILPAA